MLVVVAYDIADDKRRMRLRARLMGYGTPVQESVFECNLHSSSLKALRRHIGQIVRPPADRVRVYLLCADCAARTQDETGTIVAPDPQVIVV